MTQLQMRKIRETGLSVTTLGMGGAGLAGMYTSFDRDQAAATVLAGYEAGIRFFDTAPQYGYGRSEEVMGEVLSGLDRDSFVVSTKVGRLLVDAPEVEGTEFGAFSDLPPTFEHLDYSRDGVLRSFEESLGRLGLDRVDVLLIHDPAPSGWDEIKDQIASEAYPALEELRSQGVVRAIGAGLNDSEKFIYLAERGDYDCVLIALRYNLIDTSALDELLPLCTERNIGVYHGGPYSSGILASDPDVETDLGTRHWYAKAPAQVVERASRLKAVCERYDVPLKAVALQFGLAHPAVVSTIPGPRSPSEAKDNVAMALVPVPDQIWEEMKAEDLIPLSAPVPSGEGGMRC